MDHTIARPTSTPSVEVGAELYSRTMVREAFGQIPSTAGIVLFAKNVEAGAIGTAGNVRSALME